MHPMSTNLTFRVFRVEDVFQRSERTGPVQPGDNVKGDRPLRWREWHDMYLVTNNFKQSNQRKWHN